MILVEEELEGIVSAESSSPADMLVSETTMLELVDGVDVVIALSGTVMPMDEATHAKSDLMKCEFHKI